MHAQWTHPRSGRGGLQCACRRNSRLHGREYELLELQFSATARGHTQAFSRVFDYLDDCTEKLLGSALPTFINIMRRQFCSCLS
jgi:hypothetical protein